ncbi:hypothetical protein [Arcticibacterium luteifluviistationis]|uniref:Uncharacterized protein n=1 Tax=Arcticibacterium luteifluviistationis TaxID=1784714 RepID=A0A2Z4G6F7_9BACT|nr:hypothetical protein [Arcticibacterium luteifluviistationis]AWV96726.1 hypothetical protein DJ013_00370 [Arcticibacterium luteifluviistationis]
MPHFPNNILSLALQAAYGLASFATGLPLLDAIIGGFATNAVSSSINIIDLKKVQNLIKRPKPSELNHDLEKTIHKALVWAVRNIEHLYEPHAKSKRANRRELTRVRKSLLDEIEKGNSLDIIKDDNIIRQIDGLHNADELVNSFFKKIDSLPNINEDHPFPVFF